MASSLTVAGIGPYSIKYFYQHDGAGGAGSGVALRTQAQIMADLLAGNATNHSPLLDLITAGASTATWDDLPISAQFSLYNTDVGLDATVDSKVIADLQTVIPEGRVLRVFGADALAGQAAIIELRFHHSYDR